MTNILGAYLKLTPEDKPEAAVCKVYSVVPQAPLPIPEAFDPCFNPNQYNTSSSYTLELKAELNTDILYKKVLFSFPPLVSFCKCLLFKKKKLVKVPVFVSN